ncbi:MAG: hypothetical protein SFV24_07940 [Gemmatimonadales bacterium]|nr:hypothetical protein [Gemmatimonadales bacterium]
MRSLIPTLAALAASTALLGACQAGAATEPSGDPATRNGAVTTGGTTSTTGTASVRLRCEVRSNRSKISVDGRNLRPATGTFSARAKSGASVATAGAKAAISGEAEFDFDSDPGDIAEGAVAIPAGFIVGSVTGEILDGTGAVVATATASCTAK